MDYPSASLASKIAAITREQAFHISNAQADTQVLFGEPEFVVESPFSIQQYLQQFESDSAKRLYEEMCTNQHPPVFIFVYNGGRNVHYTTCEGFGGECGWCVGDDGGLAAACRARIDLWLDSVYSPSVTDFTPMESAGNWSKGKFGNAFNNGLELLHGEQTFTPHLPAEFSHFDPVPYVGVDDSASMSPLNPLYVDDDDDGEEEEEEKEEFVLSSSVRRELLGRELMRQQLELEEYVRNMAEEQEKGSVLLELERHRFLIRELKVQQIEREECARQLAESRELPEPFPAFSTPEVVKNTPAWSEQLFSDGTSPSFLHYEASVASTIPEDLEILASWENLESPRRPIPIRYVQRQCPLIEPFPAPSAARHMLFSEPLENCTLCEEDVVAEWTNPKSLKSDTIEPFPASGTSPLWTPFLNIPVEEMSLCAEDIGAMWVNDECSI